MSEVRVSDTLEGSTTLWRYMSLDKFIDLLSMNQLYFAPLAFYMKTDPFEGFLPAVCLEADTNSFKGLIGDMLPILNTLQTLCSDASQEAARNALEKVETAFKSILPCLTD
jgi:hypothetical protein